MWWCGTVPGWGSLWALSSRSAERMQALLATGLLQLRPFKPRTTATFGVIASAMNCYMLAPTLQAWLHSWLAVPAKLSLKTA